MTTLSSTERGEPIQLVVVGRRCVYLNDYRIAGGKPYVSENLPQHDFTITVDDVLSAMPMLTLKGVDMAAHLDGAIASFDGDPADSDYQRGYLAALVELRRVVSGEQVPA